MSIHASVVLALTSTLAVSSLAEPRWELAAREDGIFVYARSREGATVQEVKASGLIEAPPDKVWDAIRNYEGYTQTMPYTEQSKVLSTEEDGKVIYFYSVVSAPLVAKRDYVIKIVDESTWKGTERQQYKVSWTTSTQGPAESKDIIRVKINDGYWVLEPREDGKRTFATYWLYTDPGGTVPKWLVNRANARAVPDVFKAVRKASAKPTP